MRTRSKLVASLAFAAGILTAIAAMPTAQAQTGVELVTNGPQFNAGDRSGSWSAQGNVRDSQRYEALVQTNPGFRANRMHKECGPIDDPQLRSDCIASFGR
jgi:glucose dehydrogenase